MLGEIEQRIRDIKNDLHLNERTKRTKRSFDVISSSILGHQSGLGIIRHVNMRGFAKYLLVFKGCS